LIKVQTYDADLGWMHATRAGEMPEAWGVLAGYRKNWPGEQHRLVDVSNDGTVYVIDDDLDALSVFDND
jgi:hypothetical protein